ncbi:MAG: class I SAM-dependent rRNA methyltransferase [Nannocystaceae bacterium]|nr:class I SAM-dependent rRNA methyltransferase [Nannocystaceae bacterium]
MANEPVLVLRRKLKRALAGGHPWIYRDALDGAVPRPGTVVRIEDERGRFVVRGLAEEGSIAVRVLQTRDRPVDDALIERRIAAAVALRARVVPPNTDAYRLLNGEGDRLPGVVCDVYGQYATVALDGSAATAWRQRWLSALKAPLEQLGVSSVMVRSGRRAQRQVELAWGRPAPDRLAVTEHGMTLLVDLQRGQKTGLFLDHRPARRYVRTLSEGARVLDLYAYVGGFSAAAGLGGAKAVTTVDIAEPAIVMAKEAWAANGLDPQRQRAVAEGVPEFLEACRRAGDRFDVIVADPPSFAPNAGSVRGALRAYDKLHRACLELLSPGGWLLAASCSSHVDAATFDRVLGEAAGKASRVMQVVARWGAPEDHPRLAAFPEGDYLAVVVARALD